MPDIENVRQLLRSKQYIACEHAAKALLRHDDTQFEVWYILAEWLKHHLQFAPALSAALKVLNHAPNQVYPTVVAIECCIQLGLASVAAPYVRQLQLAHTPNEQGRHAEYFFSLGLHDEAWAHLRQAQHDFPDDEFLTHVQGMFEMCAGDTVAGMAHYQSFVSRRFHEQYRGSMQNAGWDFAKLWQGEDVAGKTILIIPHGGVGDYLQFIRYAQHLKQLGAVRVLAHLPNPRFKGLIASAQGVDAVIDHPSEHAFDYWTDPFGLCVYMQPQVGFAASHSYLQIPDSDFAQTLLPQIRERAAGRRCIALSWYSDAGSETRSVALAHLLPLFGLSNVHWVIVQRGYALDELRTTGLAEQCSVVSEDATFDDTAAIVAGLDGVVTIESYMLHLAGAIGKPVYFMAGRTLDWRHMNEETRSVWYPTVRLMRQPTMGDWRAVVDELVAHFKNEDLDAR